MSDGVARAVAPWLRPDREAWIEGVRGWARTQVGLADAGDLEIVRERPWSLVMRVAGIFVKAAGRGGAHEPALVQELAGAFPDLVPAPLAVDAASGLMAMRDLGPTLRAVLAGAPAVPHWSRILPRYAELQMATARTVERWTALGLPDRGAGRLPSLVERLLGDEGRRVGVTPEIAARTRRLLPELERCCAELASMPLSTAIDHGDLHDGNVAVREGGYWLYDWGDACLCHPFVSLLVTCRLAESEHPTEELPSIRDPYLEAWTVVASRRELRRLFDVAMWVAHATRALDWAHMLRDADGALLAPYLGYVPFWLGALADRRPGTA